MNIGELREAFEALVDDSVDNAMFIVWLNEALEDLAMEYGPVKYTTYNAVANIEYDLPPDHLRTIEIKDKNGQRYLSFEVSEWGKIRFLEDGDYTLYYHRVPTRLLVGDDSLKPDIHEVLQTPMYIYAAAKFFERESEGDPEESSHASKFMSQYSSMKYDRAQKLRNRAYKPTRVRTSTWR